MCKLQSGKRKHRYTLLARSGIHSPRHPLLLQSCNPLPVEYRELYKNWFVGTIYLSTPRKFQKQKQKKTEDNVN